MPQKLRRHSHKSRLALKATQDYAVPVKDANILKIVFFLDSQNFDVSHRANARTHAQAETANRLLSLCSIGSSKENQNRVEI